MRAEDEPWDAGPPPLLRPWSVKPAAYQAGVPPVAARAGARRNVRRSKLAPREPDPAHLARQACTKRVVVPAASSLVGTTSRVPGQCLFPHAPRAGAGP